MKRTMWNRVIIAWNSKRMALKTHQGWAFCSPPSLFTYYFRLLYSPTTVIAMLLCLSTTLFSYLVHLICTPFILIAMPLCSPCHLVCSAYNLICHTTWFPLSFCLFYHFVRHALLLTLPFLWTDARIYVDRCWLEPGNIIWTFAGPVLLIMMVGALPFLDLSSYM